MFHKHDRLTVTAQLDNVPLPDHVCVDLVVDTLLCRRTKKSLQQNLSIRMAQLIRLGSLFVYGECVYTY